MLSTFRLYCKNCLTSTPTRGRTVQQEAAFVPFRDTMFPPGSKNRGGKRQDGMATRIQFHSRSRRKSKVDRPNHEPIMHPAFYPGGQDRVKIELSD